MPRLFLLTLLLLMSTACSDDNSSSPRVQNYGSVSAISTMPIKAGAPVTFRHEISEDHKAVLLRILREPPGKAGITSRTAIMLEDKPPEMIKIELSPSRLTRRVHVSQGQVVLYQKEEHVSAGNLEALSTWYTHSDEWVSLPTPNAGDVHFAVEYAHFPEVDGEMMINVIIDTVDIPIEGE